MKFVNIDRITWRQDPAIPFDGEKGMKPISEEDSEGLRAIFHINSTETLDGKRVLIIDEQRETGDTQTVAKKLFKLAFPSSEVDTAEWIAPSSKYNASTGEHVPEPKEIPVWYPKKDMQNGLFGIEGRGIYDPDPNTPPTNQRYTQASMQFLGTTPKTERRDEEYTEEENEAILRLHEQYNLEEDTSKKEKIREKIELFKHGEYDPKSEQLRKEIGQLVLDAMNHRLYPLVRNSREEVFGLTREEYYKKRQQTLKERKFGK